MSTSSNQIAISLAILNVSWADNKDYIALFLPIVAEGLRLSNTEVVVLENLQEVIVENFGISVPQPALKTLLNRASKVGLVTPENKIYRINRAQLGSSKLRTDPGDAPENYEVLLADLIAHTKTAHSIDWSRSDADVAFLGYLEEHSMPVLNAVLHGLPIAPPIKHLQHSNYIVYSFVDSIAKTNRSQFDFLTSLVKGRMLVDALLFPDIGTVSQKFNNVEVYIDTPFALRVLGYEGPQRAVPCLETIQLLRKLDAVICMFRHNVDELIGVLRACEGDLRKRNRYERGVFKVYEQFLRSGKGPGDVAHEISTLERSLADLCVHIKDAPSHSPTLEIDEVELGKCLQEIVGYSRDTTRDIDMASLTAIHRLRRGVRIEKLETCKALFVTPNDKLAIASEKFFKGSQSRVTVPHCFLDHVFCTLAWLKVAPEYPDMAQHRILANAYAALNPSDALWARYLEKAAMLETAGKISADDYALLRWETCSRDQLMSITFGDPQAFTEGTVEQVLEHAKEVVTREARAQIATEQEEKLAALAEGSRERTKRIQAEQRGRKTQEAYEDAVRRADEAEKKLSLQLAEAIKRDEYVRRVTGKIGRSVGVILYVFLVFVFMCGLLERIPAMQPVIHRYVSGWLSVASIILLILDMVLHYLHSVSGYSIKRVVGYIQSFAETIAAKILRFVMHAEKLEEVSH